jgi:hypothetical protein
MMSQFAMSHSHLEVADEPKHWVEYCLLHTVDVEPSWWCNWVMGYLNYQIVCFRFVWRAVINQQKRLNTTYLFKWFVSGTPSFPDDAAI